MASDAASIRTIVEQEAEHLVVFQLDLLAQLEHQLRAVHLTMRQIEKLRGDKDRAGGALSNGQKIEALDDLRQELDVIDKELNTQHQSCQLMLATVEQMRDQLRRLRNVSSATTGARQAIARQGIDQPPPASSRHRRRSAKRR